MSILFFDYLEPVFFTVFNFSHIILIVFIFSGLVIGGLLGDIASKTPGFSWLAYGQSFGFTEPLKLDLNIIKLTLGFGININIASIVGMAIGIFIYRKV